VIEIVETSSIDERWRSQVTVRLGHPTAGSSSADQYFLVSCDGRPALRIDYCRPPEESSPFQAHGSWRDWVVLGLGHRLYLVHVESRLVRDRLLGSYFGAMWLEEEFLLATSAERVFKLDPEGDVVWSSPPVGVDGVIVTSVTNGIVHGEGEWDPPRGLETISVVAGHGEDHMRLRSAQPRAKARTRAAATTVERGRRRPHGVSFATVCELATALPGVDEAPSWGTPGLKVKGRFLARLKEDGESMVLRIGFARREELLKEAPAVFYVTDHYLGYPAVLVRLAKVRRSVLRSLLQEAWSEVASELPVAAPRSRPRGSRTRRKGKSR
jgi:hypothetical protein